MPIHGCGEAVFLRVLRIRLRWLSRNAADAMTRDQAWPLIVIVACACGRVSEPSLFEVGDLDAADEQDAETIPLLDYDGPVPDGFPFDPPVPPTFPCLDAGPDASACPLPRSVCQGDWLEYFDDGKCVDGKCQFTCRRGSAIGYAGMAAA